MTNDDVHEQASAVAEAAEQDSYLPPDVPEGYLLAPGAPQFANATWMAAGPEVYAVVEEVLAFNDADFSLLGEMYFECRWRRRTAPERNGGPVFASLWVPDDRVIWEAEQQGTDTYPRWCVDLHWKHFEALRADDHPPAVHRDLIMRDIHYGLLGLDVDSGLITKVQPTLARSKNVERYGAHGDLLGLKQAFDGWPAAGEG